MNFTDVTVTAQLPIDSSPTFGATWADYDKDGWLDLFVTNRPFTPEIVSNYLYHNNQDGTFTDVTLQAGVADSGHAPFCASFFDYNLDGWEDIYIAQDKGAGNTLFKNNGNGTFSEVSVATNSNLSMDAMSVTNGDPDKNNYPDIYITNTHAGNRLLMNTGNNNFIEAADSLGVAMYSIGWGAIFFDSDNDGDEDLYVCTVKDNTVGASNRLYENDGTGSFTENPSNGLPGDTLRSYGSAIGDFDNDGYYDVAVVNSFLGQKNQLWQNIGDSNNWIKMSLTGTISNRDAIGTTIEVWCGLEKFWRFTQNAIGYIGQNSQHIIIGVGQNTVIDSIILKWPNGLVEQHVNYSVNQWLTFTEGSTVPSCEVPGLLLTNYINPNSARLNWNQVSGAVNYKIRGQRLGSSSWVSLNLSGMDSIKAVYGLQNNSTYIWQIQAICDSFDSITSSWSVYDTFTTGCQAPDTIFTLPITSTAAQFNWSYVPGAQVYEIKGRMVGNLGWISLFTNGGNTSTQVFGLNTATQYEWKIKTWCDSVRKSLSTEGIMFTTASSNLKLKSDGIDEKEWIVFPNPFYSEITINASSQNDSFPLSFFISDEMGLAVYSGKLIRKESSNPFKLDLSFLSPGIYFLNIHSSTETGFRKIVKF